MRYKISPKDLTSIHLNEQDKDRAIIQNVAIILSTWKGTVPLYRDFGIAPNLLHKPLNVAEAMLRSEIREAIEKYEPRVEIDKITFDLDGDKLIPTVEVNIIE